MHAWIRFHHLACKADYLLFRLIFVWFRYLSVCWRLVLGFDFDFGCEGERKRRADWPDGSEMIRDSDDSSQVGVGQIHGLT